MGALAGVRPAGDQVDRRRPGPGKQNKARKSNDFKDGLRRPAPIAGSSSTALLFSIVFRIDPHCIRSNAFFLVFSKASIVKAANFPLQIDCIS
jgi:hypothetical protein